MTPEQQRQAIVFLTRIYGSRDAVLYFPELNGRIGLFLEEVKATCSTSTTEEETK